MILLNGKRIDSTIGDALPIGTLSPFVGLVAPKGYLICMGQLVDKAKYPELWELCGDTFGPSTTAQFYLPDLRGQTIAGYKQGDAMFGTLGALIGGKTTSYTPAGTNTGGAVGNHTLTAAESGLPKHSHTMDDPFYKFAELQWGFEGEVFKGDKYQDHTKTTNETGGTSATSGHNHGFTNPTFTGTQANISTVQPTAIMNWIIKASMLAVVTSNIEDSLTSTSATDALSARQGKVLNDKMEWKKGDSVSIDNFSFGGLSGGSGGRFYFNVPMGKPMSSDISTQNVTITVKNTCSVRYNGSNYAVTSLTVENVFNETGNIRVYTNDLSLPANIAAGIFGGITIVFS